MTIDLKKLGLSLTAHGLTGKAVDQYSREEIECLVASCLESLIPDKIGPFRKPFIEGEDLVIPYNSDPKYHWWKPYGQSIADTLRELQVTDKVWKNYCL
jgi:hypothetical protein